MNIKKCVLNTFFFYQQTREQSTFWMLNFTLPTGGRCACKWLKKLGTSEEI